MTLPTALSEMDRLKLALAKEKQSRLQAEAANLGMAQRAVNGAIATLEKENAVLFERLKVDYQLAPNDEVSEDGAITRAPVRIVKEG